MGATSYFSMANDLAREIQEVLDDMQATSQPPRQHGSWSAFARIYDVKGTSCWCQLFDNNLLPRERTMDFMMDFSRVDPCFHASCVKQPGLLIGALELNVVDLNPIKALVMEDTIMWNIPMLKPEQPWAISHMFAGAFSGWSQAANFFNHNFEQCSIDSQVAVELDRRTIYAWSASFEHPIVATPLGPDFLPPPGGYYGIAGSVHDKTILRALSWTSNSIFTLSPPCPAWSRGGRSFGLHAPDGWDFFEVTQLCMLGKPLACLFECSDDVDKHTHFVHIKHAMQLAGYTLVVSQNVAAHEVTNNLRTRWFGIWVRNDVAQPPFVLPKLCGRHLEPWHSQIYQFKLPQCVIDALTLDAHLQEVYGDVGLLPSNKRRAAGPLSQLQVLDRRRPDPKFPLPTLCASYGSQHHLHVSHLQTRGLYTFLTVDQGRWAFISPFTFASLMGCTQQLDMPNDMQFIFKVIGNAVTVPQATFLLASAFNTLAYPNIDPASAVHQVWDQRLTSSNAVVFNHGDRLKLTRNQLVADHCQLHLGQMNGIMVAAHAVHFHEEERQAYLPVLPSDLPLSTILLELPMPTYLNDYFTIIDENRSDIGTTNWGNLQCGSYQLLFRGITCGSFTVNEIQENAESAIEISPTLPLFPRDLEREFAAEDHFFLRALHHGYVHAAEHITTAKDNIKGDCIFYTFDGTFRALLPGASYDRLRSIPHRFGEQNVIQYTALHHLASVKTLGLPGIVCLKEPSMQAIADRGLVVLIITDPTKLEGCFITTASVLTPHDVDRMLGGNYRITKHNMMTITHFEPVRVCSGDVIEVCEQPFGLATRSSFPSLRLEYHERTAHTSPAVLQPPQQEEDDPISDASEAEEIEDASSNDSRADCADAVVPTGSLNGPCDHDALNGGAWNDEPNAVQRDDGAAPDDLDLYAGGTKKKKKKSKYDWPVEGTKEQPGPGGWYTPAGSDPAAKSLGFPIPPCKICKRPMERSEGSLTGQCPRCNESFNNWGAFYMCPIPQHMKHAICGKCIEGDKSDSAPAAGPSEEEKQEMLHAVKAAKLTPKGSVQKMLQGKAKLREDDKEKEKVPPKEQKPTHASGAKTPKSSEKTPPGGNIQKKQEHAEAKAGPQKPPASLKESPTAALASALKKRREEDPLTTKNPKDPKVQKIFHQKDVKTTSKAAPQSSAPPVDDKKSKTPAKQEGSDKGSSSTPNPKSKSSAVIQPKKMPVSKFAPLNPDQPTKIGLSTATSLRHARVRQVIAQEPLYMLMGEMRLALGLYPTDAERALIAIHYIDEPEEFDIEQGVRPEGLYAVLWKQHWVGFEIATIGGDPDHFLVHMWGLPKEHVGKWRSIWASHLAGFKTDFLVHNEVSEQGLCGWRLLQCWATSKKWDTSKKLDAKILPKDDREIVLRSKLAWRQAGPDFVNFASKVRAAFLANYDSYPADDTHWAASGGAPDTIDVDSPKAPSTAATASNMKPDPWANYDPWQKKKTVRQSRWEDLELPDNHPFSSPTGAKLQFVRQQELGPSKGGVAFATKSSVPQLMELRPKEPALLLIPQLLQEDPLQGISNLRGPVEVIVIDPALQTTYKRQVHMIVLNQDPKSVIHSLPPPSISLTVADIAELIVECDARVVNKDVFQAFTDNPIHRFKNTFKEHCDIDFWANCAFYSYKFLKPKEGDRHAGVHQCILKVQKAHRLGLLSFSGKNDLFIRDYVQKGSTVLDLSVLPRFWDVTKEARLDLLKAASKLPGFYGLVITKRGLAPRFDVKKLCSAREALLPQDDRLTDLNRSLIPRYTRESTGWPTGILAKDVVLAVHKAVATTCIPIRSYRSSGCVAWTLAFQDLPTSFVFSVKVNEAVYEILITEKALPDKPSKGKGKGKTGKSKRSPSPATSTAVSTSSATIQEERIDRLEAKVGTLEKKHDALDHKIDNHYSGLSNQLRQVLQHLATPKTHEPSGDTPPPKQPRHA